LIELIKYINSNNSTNSFYKTIKLIMCVDLYAYKELVPRQNMQTKNLYQDKNKQIQENTHNAVHKHNIILASYNITQ